MQSIFTTRFKQCIEEKKYLDRKQMKNLPEN